MNVGFVKFFLRKPRQPVLPQVGNKVQETVCFFINVLANKNIALNTKLMSKMKKGVLVDLLDWPRREFEKYS